MLLQTMKQLLLEESSPPLFNKKIQIVFLTNKFFNFAGNPSWITLVANVSFMWYIVV